MDKPLVPEQIRTVFEGRIFTVQIETITLPKGGRFDADIVRHPGSVVLVPITGEGRIVLVRQYRHPIGRWVWELPAGSLKPGEDPQKAAARECQEEIGLVPSAVEKLGSLFPTPGYCDEEMNFYRLTGLRAPGDGDPVAHPDEDEDIESKAFSVAEIHAMVDRGEIVDMKTVAALYWMGRP
ncbi:MAG: NUDIX hydrolase [Acidobacteria bacterium]|nr:NUDIX hydrolase [Acidobacteriota bacterium]